jgi:hypothetical protein
MVAFITFSSGVVAIFCLTRKIIKAIIQNIVVS